MKDQKRINVWAPIRTYNRLKAKAAREGKTVTEVVLSLVDLYLAGKVKV